MKTLLNSKIPKIGGVLFAAMFASSVSATIVNLDFDSGFIQTGVDAHAGIDGSTDVADNTTGSAGVSAVYEMLNWISGDPGHDDSTLSVVNGWGLDLDSTIIGDMVTLQTFTQVNNVQGSTFAWELDITNELLINGISTGVIDRTIEFNETSNAGGVGPCGGLSPSGAFCDDIYNLTDPEAMIPVAGEAGLFVHVFLEAGAGVTCNTLGTDVTCYTPEEAPGTSQVFVKAELVRVSIPEPSLLALFGLGLFGLGASRLRKS